jgi:hypothetical protein
MSRAGVAGLRRPRPTPTATRATVGERPWMWVDRLRASGVERRSASLRAPRRTPPMPELWGRDHRFRRPRTTGRSVLSYDYNSPQLWTVPKLARTCKRQLANQAMREFVISPSLAKATPRHDRHRSVRTQCRSGANPPATDAEPARRASRHTLHRDIPHRAWPSRPAAEHLDSPGAGAQTAAGPVARRDLAGLRSQVGRPTIRPCH